MKIQNKNIIYGCYPSFTSLYFINLLIVKYQVPIKAILISKKSLRIDKKKIEGLKGIIYFIKRFDAQFCFYQILLGVLLPMLIRVREFICMKNKINSFKYLSRRYKFSLIYSKNFNSKAFRGEISQLDANIFISMGLDQILNEDFIKLFKDNCLNIHPSKLPDFRGPDPIFEFLLSKESKMGVTIHQINTAIDKGPILSTSIIHTSKKDTHFSLLKKSVEEGSKLFIKYLGAKVNNPLSQDRDSAKYSYKSWPSKPRLKLFRKQKKKYFTIKDILNIF